MRFPWAKFPRSAHQLHPHRPVLFLSWEKHGRKLNLFGHDGVMGHFEKFVKSHSNESDWLQYHLFEVPGEAYTLSKFECKSGIPILKEWRPYLMQEYSMIYGNSVQHVVAGTVMPPTSRTTLWKHPNPKDNHPQAMNQRFKMWGIWKYINFVQCTKSVKDIRKYLRTHIPAESSCFYMIPF